MKEKLIEIINTINSHEDWNNLQKMRYAYIEIGKNVHLNAKFFYSLYQVLDENNTFSLDEIKEIYSNNKPVYDVICRDCAIMLKTVFDACGINSFLMEMTNVDYYDVENEIVDIHHTFICAEDENHNKYFMKLSADLPYIQLGLETDHFAYHLHYFNKHGNHNYLGPEIKEVALSKKELRKLDESLNYVNIVVDNKNEYLNVVFDMMKEANQKYKEYTYQLATSMDNKFYNGLIKVLSEDSESLSADLSKISFAKWNEVKKYICKMVKEKINEEIYNFDEWTEKKYEQLLDNKEYDKYITNLRDVINKNKNDLIFNNDEYSLLALTTGATKLIKVIGKLERNTEYRSKELKSLKSNFNVYVQKIATVFIDKKYQIERNNSFSNEYIINKIKILFPRIFDFNHSTDFTKMYIGEKVRIIDMVLEHIFPELSKDKTVLKKKYKDRIRTVVIYDKLDNEYKLVILVDVHVNESTKAFIYNFNDNKNYFENPDEDISLLEMKSNTDRYAIMSKSLSLQARDNEDDAEKGKKR